MDMLDKNTIVALIGGVIVAIALFGFMSSSSGGSRGGKQGNNSAPASTSSSAEPPKRKLVVGGPYTKYACHLMVIICVLFICLV